MSILNMPKISYEYDYCNYCKYFDPLDYSNKYNHGTGLCHLDDKTVKAYTTPTACWYQGCACYEFTIQNYFGFNSPKELEEYKDRTYIVNALRDNKYKIPLKDRIHKKYTRLKKIITSLHHD